MPQDITINGAQYPDVPAVQIPKTGGGTAQFDDTTDATATASDLALGKTAYVNNVRLTGTGSMVEPPLYIDTSLNSVGVGAAPTKSSELQIADGYSLNALGKNNRFDYMPYSWTTAGSSDVSGYARIATITITGTYMSQPFHFVVWRALDKRPIDIYMHFYQQANTDPALESIYVGDTSGERADSPFSAFAYKISTSVWGVYVKKVAAGDIMSVTTYLADISQRKCSVSYVDHLYASVPSGAFMATPVPCLNPTVTITKTGGNSTASGVKFYRSGNVCHLSFNLATSAVTAAGSNVFTGTTDAPVPVITTTNASYYGATALITDIGATGNIVVRVEGASLASGSNAYCNVVYLTSK